MSISQTDLEELKNKIKEQEKKIKEQQKIIDEQKTSLVDLLTNPQPSKKPFIPIKLYSGGLPPYKEEQQIEFLENEELREDKDITEPRDKFYNPKNNKFDTLTLQKHQEKFITKFINSDARGAILFHGTGTGKTISAVVASWAYLRYNPTSKVFVITPSATLQNFIFGMVQFGLDVRDNRYNFYTFERYFRNRPNCDDSLMIIDEAHNLRTEIKTTTRKKIDKITGDVEIIDRIQNSKGLSILEHCAKVAKKVLLLTATPFINSIYDIENLVSMVQGKDPYSPETFSDIATSSSARQDYFRCLVSKFELPVSDDFPDKREVLVPIYMDKKYLRKYEKIQNTSDKSIRAYYNGIRRLSNTLGGVKNQKIQWVIDLIKKGGKTVVYSTFLDTGIDILKKFLKKLKINYAEITGRQNATLKEISKNRFNHYIPDNENYKKKIKKLGFDINKRNKYDVDLLLITKASGEGVDLIGTRNMVLLDGAWNESSIQQIIARAVRYRSHTHLPKNQQFVNIYRLILVKPDDKKIIDKINSNEFPQWKTILTNILDKDKIKKELSKTSLKKTLIKDKTKKLRDITLNKKIVNNTNLTLKEVKNLSRTKREKLLKQIEFKNLDVLKNEAKILGNLDRPGIDLYMIIRSKTKQLVINNFVSAMSSIETLEECVSPLETEFFNKVNEIQEKTGKEISIKEKDKLRLELFGKELERFSKRLVIKNEKILNDLNNILNKTEEQATKQLDKSILDNLQEYFTPPEVAKKMIDKIDLLNDKRDDLRILEPSAGEGALILPLIKRMSTGEQFYKIDLVEFSNDNRKFLEDFEHSDYIELMKERNFLKFLPNQNYDYIIMNPPFHLKRTNHRNLYKKDVWDVQFIKRAFGMLKKGGKLIAITSQAFINNTKEPFGDFNDWIKTKNHSIEKTNTSWKNTFSKNKKKQELMSKLSLKNFVYITLIKEEKDLKFDKELLDIDWSILKGKPKLLDNEPVKLMENNKNQDPITVLNINKTIKNTPSPIKKEPKQIKEEEPIIELKPEPFEDDKVKLLQLIETIKKLKKDFNFKNIKKMKIDTIKDINNIKESFNDKLKPMFEIIDDIIKNDNELKKDTIVISNNLNKFTKTVTKNFIKLTNIILDKIEKENLESDKKALKTKKKNNKGVLIV